MKCLGRALDPLVRLSNTLTGRIYYNLLLLDVPVKFLSELSRTSEKFVIQEVKFLKKNGFIKVSDRRDTAQDLMDKGIEVMRPSKMKVYRQYPAPVTRKDVDNYRKANLKFVGDDNKSDFTYHCKDLKKLVPDVKSYSRMVYYRAKLDPLFDYWRTNGLEVEEDVIKEFFHSDSIRTHLIEIMLTSKGEGYDNKQNVDIMDVLTKFFILSISRGLAKRNGIPFGINEECVKLVDSLDDPETLMTNLRLIKPMTLSSMDIAAIMHGKSPFIEKRS